MEDLKKKIEPIRLLLTDCDGVLTDTGVYYGADGEVLKRFSIRDGMGVERLRKLCKVETGIISGELSPSLKKRAEKLMISDLYLGIKDKRGCLEHIMAEKKLKPEQIAFIGDDVNDLEIIKMVGLSACPADGMEMIKSEVDYICQKQGGNGAFREFAELILKYKNA